MDLETLRKRIEAALADRRRRVVDAEDLIPAAVLLLLTNRGGPHVLFAQRTERVAHHKGQYSCP
ncbi:MAG: CoA pyrophosphatase, partial [Candidatus Rokubacteria bacterium]|nr:CoA pyrophosphatase [Candidatus Rokubacteria bacterium]